MQIDTNLAREIGYAATARTLPGRCVIRAMENATGRLGLIRRMRRAAPELGPGQSVWRSLTETFGLTIELAGGSLDHLPATGPLVVVSNHPFGILDGLVMGRLLSDLRGDAFRILAHRVFAAAPQIERAILPISFDGTREAARLNLDSRSEALRHLDAGGAIGIFPGGTVSTAGTPMGLVRDPAWRAFTAKMIARSDATIVPVWFEGANSRLFQIASHLHYNLRMGLMIREFAARVDRPVRIVVGKPIPRDTLDPRDPVACMDSLRRSTYSLSPKALDPTLLGYEFEAKYKGRGDGSGHFRQWSGRTDGPEGDLRPAS